MSVLEYALTSTKAAKHHVATTILKESCLNRTLFPEIQNDFNGLIFTIK